MKKILLVNVALLLAVVALAWFIHRTPPRNEPVAYPMSTLKAGAVRHIRLERRGQPPVVLEMKGGQWFMISPFPARAGAFNVLRLLSILGARATARLAATDLARFDLDRPATRLTVDSQTFSFGTVSAVAREQYVLTGDQVYTVEPRYGAALPADPAQLIDHRLFARGESPVRFELGDFTVENSGGKWTVIPMPANLSGDDINRWVDDWRQASALRAAPYGSSKPVGEITVVLQDGRTLVLGILQRKPELVLLRPDENVEFHFLADPARRLLSPPSGSAANH